mmetsp:Transcript_33993/g.90569  ORF Transcript_33993/g.90569 Transcript_33993/m.90569 type:complete len:105 (+) Transcript_33993:97-411(+)
MEDARDPESGGNSLRTNWRWCLTLSQNCHVSEQMQSFVRGKQRLQTNNSLDRVSSGICHRTASMESMMSCDACAMMQGTIKIPVSGCIKAGSADRTETLTGRDF